MDVFSPPLQITRLTPKAHVSQLDHHCHQLQAALVSCLACERVNPFMPRFLIGMWVPFLGRQLV